MKKKIVILCVILLIFIVGCLLYFSNGSTIPVFNKGTVSLKDYYHSIKADFHYLKDTYTIEEDNTGDYPSITLNKEGTSIKIGFLENYSNAIEEDLFKINDDESYKDIKEVKYSKYKGYSYNYNDEYTYVMLLLSCEEKEKSSLGLCTSVDFTIKGEFNKEVEDIIKSISVSKNYSGSLNIDGVVSTNHKYVVKRFKVDDYKVYVYKKASYINVEIFNDEKKFLAMIKEGLSKYEGSLELGDYTLHGSEEKSDLDDYSKLYIGSFTKELDFTVKFYSNNLEEELFNKFIVNVLDNIEIIK